MRLSLGIAIAIFALSRAAFAEPVGPDAQTLAWWQSSAREGQSRQWPPWARNFGTQVAVPSAAAIGDGAAYDAVIRLAVAGVCDGFAIAGEVLASEDPAKPEPRSIWARIALSDKDAPNWLASTLGPIDNAKPLKIGDAQAFQISPHAGDPPIYWVVMPDRLVVGTTERAILRALSAPAEGDPGAILKDYQGLVKARDDKRPNSPRLFEAYLAINALRHEFEESFSGGRGSRLLAAWQLTNGRGAAVFASCTQPDPGMKDDPAFVRLEGAYSSRTEAPGAGRCISFTTEGLSRMQMLLRPPGATTLLMLDREPRAILDWAVRLYRATLAAEPETSFAQQWRAWLGNQRTAMTNATEDLQKYVVIGLGGASAGNEQPDAVAIPFRIGIVSGIARQRTARQIGTIVESVGAAHVERDGAGVAWKIPYTLPWFHGSVAWTDLHFGDAGVITGVLELGDGDAVKALPPPEKK